MKTKRSNLAPAQAGCLIRIKSAIESFKPSERAVADFVLQNPERVMHMSISEASQNIGVGESLLVQHEFRAIESGGDQWIARLPDP